MKLLVFVGFCISHFIYLSYNLYVSKFADSKVLFGVTFSSHWTYALAALVLATPILTLANYIFSITFYYGTKATPTVWVVLVFFLAAQLVAMVLVPKLMLGQMPSMATFVGALLALSGLFVAMKG